MLRSSNRIAGTLIEVVVGLAMLGSILSVLLIQTSKLNSLHRASTEKLEAVEMLDRILQLCHTTGYPPIATVQSTGTDNRLVKDNGKAWFWSIKEVRSIAFSHESGLDLITIRVAIFSPDRSRTVVHETPLAFADVVVSRSQIASKEL